MKNISFKEINTLAIPAIISGIAEPIISFTDLTLVGKYLDHEALAGVGIGSFSIMLFILIFSSIRNSTTSIVAQYFGKEDKGAIDQTITKALIISFGIGVILIVLSNLFARSIFEFQNAHGYTLEQGLLYFRIRSFGIPFMLGTLTLIGGFKGFQNTSWAMQIMLIGGTLNVVLDFLFMNGVPTVFQPMGIEGVAIASLISQIVMFLIALKHFKVHFNFKTSTTFFDANFKLLAAMSFDLIIRGIAMNSVFIFTNKYAMKYGAHHMAAHSILIAVWLFQSYFIDGYSNAAMALAGKIKGQKRYGLLYRLSMKICRINFLLALFLACLALGGFPFINKISNHNGVENVLEAAFFIMLLTFPIGSVAFTFDGIFIGLGKANFLRNTLLICTLLVFFPCLYFTNNMGLDTNGIWISILAWLTARAIIPFLYFQGKYQGFNKL